MITYKLVDVAFLLIIILFLRSLMLVLILFFCIIILLLFWFFSVILFIICFIDACKWYIIKRFICSLYCYVIYKLFALFFYTLVLFWWNFTVYHYIKTGAKGFTIIVQRICITFVVHFIVIAVACYTWYSKIRDIIIYLNWIGSAIFAFYIPVRLIILAFLAWSGSYFHF